ncbi:MAG: 3-oxoacyl-[acyl-carrier-protein] reductase [candidate division FCPU426 bacterium]
MADSGELKEKVAIVTGGTQGIGYAIARRFSQAGARVVLSGRDAGKAAAAAAAIAAETGGLVLGLRADVALSADVDAMVNNALDNFKRVDILVNNAGIAKDGLLLRMSDQDFDDVIATNLKGAFNCTRAVCKSMLKARAGSVINISSVVGLNGNPGQANYSASKAGLIGLTKSVAKELASRGIRVNAVAPGFIRTAMTSELGEEAQKALLNQIPLAKFGESEDIAEAALFLASDRSRYVTGQVLRVDGGMMM